MKTGLLLGILVAMAGGVHRLGNKGEVELYRNAGKTIYNLLSEAYEDVPLCPGDMIVVRDVFRRVREDWGDGFGDAFGGADPFGESRPRDPGKEPAVVADEDVWVPVGDDGSGAAGADPFGGLHGAPGLPMTGEIRIVAGGGVVAAEWGQFEAALKAGGEAEEAYRILKGERARTIDFYVGAARILFAAEHRTLGRQVLSNLLETSQFRLDRLAACAMWLEEFGEVAVAADLLRRGAGLMPDLPVLHYDLARLALRAEQNAQAAGHLSELVRVARHEQTSAALLALTDLTALEAFGNLPESAVERLRGQGMPRELSGVIDADLRVVMTTNQPDYELDLSVEEPSGHTCRERSPCGGKVVSTKGISEDMMRKGLPGTYLITCQSPVALTGHLTLYQNWGRENQSRREMTVAVDGGGGVVTLAEYEFAFAEEGELNREGAEDAKEEGE